MNEYRKLWRELVADILDFLGIETEIVEVHNGWMYTG